MKIMRFRMILPMLLFLSSIILLSACGSPNAAKNQGCPSDSFLANATDTLNGPASITITAPSSHLTPYPGGPQIVSPLVFTVVGKDGVPRNKICISLYTGGSIGPGIWYSDRTYSTPIAGVGLLNNVVGETDDAGTITLYWSTPFLPAASPATGTTNGADQTGTTFVQAYSGVLSQTFTVTWTVQGQPAQ